MKTILALVAIPCLLSSCADFKLAGLSVDTPYGTITSDKEGNTTIAIKAIVIDEK